MLIDALHSLPPPRGGVDQTNEINEVQCLRLWPLACAAVRQLFTVPAHSCAAPQLLSEN